MSAPSAPEVLESIRRQLRPPSAEGGKGSALGGVESKDFLLRPNQIQGFFLGVGGIRCSRAEIGLWVFQDHAGTGLL